VCFTGRLPGAKDMVAGRLPDNLICFNQFIIHISYHILLEIEFMVNSLEYLRFLAIILRFKSIYKIISVLYLDVQHFVCASFST
jgi:hypothetical protein